MNRSERFRYYEARKAGLDPEWAEKVATQEITLDDALGDMDMIAESGAVVPTMVADDGMTYCNEECRKNGDCKECIPFW